MVATIDRNVWDRVKLDYRAGNWKTLKDLSDKHGVNYSLLRNRVYGQWKQELDAVTHKVMQKMDEVKVDLGKEYLVSSFKRAKRYEAIIDKSQEMLSTDNSGTPLLDVDAIVAYSKAELNIHALAKSALRISDKFDVTSNNQSIGDSFVTAIAKLREDKSTPVLTSSQIDQVLEAELID